MIRLAILTENFQDMEGYYQIFQNLSEPSDDLTKSVCSAMVVTGKYYLQQKNKTRALEIFQAAAVASSSQSQFLLYTIETLLDFGFKDDATKFLDRMKKTALGSDHYKIADFRMGCATLAPAHCVNEGKKLLKEGIESPSVYESLIRVSLLSGFSEYAETVSEEAKKKWPKQAVRFTILSQATGS